MRHAQENNLMTGHSLATMCEVPVSQTQIKNEANLTNTMKTVILSLLATCLFAGESTTIPPGLLGKAMDALRANAANARAKEAQSVVTAPPATDGVITELLIRDSAPQTVPPNDFLILESKADYTGADRVSIALTTMGVDGRAIAILPGWVSQMGEWEWYNITDFSQFWAVNDHTGMNTPVYGRMLKIMLFNTGSKPIDVHQLTTYAVIHH
jgi:hypothetical protein